MEEIMPKCIVGNKYIEYENAYVCDKCKSCTCGECIIRYGKDCDCGGRLHHVN